MSPIKIRYRFLFAVLGCVVYLPFLAAVDLLDERGGLCDILLYLTIVPYMILSIPGLLYPLRGIYTALVVSASWGVVGFFIGRAIDNRKRPSSSETP
jgi:hypothetical protein